MSDLSPSLTDKIQHETYGLFPLPVTKYTNPDHDKHKEDILKWMSQQDLKEKHGREAICHNVTQVGDNNECLTALPWICLLYTSPSPRDRTRSRMPSSA